MLAKPLANIIQQSSTEIVTQADFDGKINRLKIVINIPDIKTIKKPRLTHRKLDIFNGLNRVVKSLPAKPIMSTTAKIENILKPSVPG